MAHCSIRIGMERNSNKRTIKYHRLGERLAVPWFNAERKPQYIGQPYLNLYGPVSTDLTFASCTNGVVSTQPILHGMISNYTGKSNIKTTLSFFYTDARTVSPPCLHKGAFQTDPFEKLQFYTCLSAPCRSRFLSWKNYFEGITSP